MKIKTKLAIGFGFILLLTIILGTTMILKMADVKQKFTFVVEHDAIAIANARQLSKLVMDMETGQRGFCITANDEFLEPYKNGLIEFKELISQEKTLVADNPSQVQKLQKIESLLNQWRQQAAEPEIAVRRKTKETFESMRKMIALFEAGTGKALMDQIRLEFDSFINIGTNLAIQRYDDACRTTERTRNTAIALLIFTVCAGVVVTILIRRSISRPLVKLAEYAKAVGEGNLGIQVKIKSSDEIGELADDFSIMISNLKDSAIGRKEAVGRLEKFNHFAVGREHQMIELKHQINDLAAELGRPPQHDLTFLQTAGEPGDHDGE